MTAKIIGMDPDKGAPVTGSKSKGPRPVREFVHYEGYPLEKVFRADGKGLTSLLAGAQRGKIRYHGRCTDAEWIVSNVGYIEVTTRGGARGIKLTVADMAEKTVGAALAYLDPVPMGAAIAQTGEEFDLESFEENAADLD